MAFDIRKESLYELSIIHRDYFNWMCQYSTQICVSYLFQTLLVLDDKIYLYNRWRGFLFG